MKTNTPPRINFDLVQRTVREFPGENWQTVHGSGLHMPTVQKPHARNWNLLQQVQKKGGNYAFLFPETFFAEEREIALDGPAKRKIPFCFSVQSHPASNGLVVVYVGKATDLQQRIQLHFGLTQKSTTAQVQYGLVKSRICTDRESAVRFMLQHAVIVYRELSGDEHTANSDLLEMSLCARFAPPFNIKSEH